MTEPTRLANSAQGFPAEVLTPEQAAAVLKVHRQTIYALLDTGELPGRKIGRQWRISGQALHEYLKGA